MNKQEYHDAAIAKSREGDWQGVLDNLRKASDLSPDDPVIGLLLGRTLLQLGDIPEGLREVEKRFNPLLPDSPQGDSYFIIQSVSQIIRQFTKPLWNGTDDLTGKTVVLFNEGGYGDCFQNIRFAHKLKERGAAKVILEAEQDVADILRDVDGVDELAVYPNRVIKLMSPKKKLSDRADYIASTQSLMYFFSPDLKDNCFKFPYLQPKPKDNPGIGVVKKSQAKLKVGIVWGGNVGNMLDPFRSTHWTCFSPLALVPGIELFSLQKGNPDRGDPVQTGEEFEYTDLEPCLHTFNDTANIIKELHAVVAVDTSTAHLAAAMCVPTYVVMTKTWAEWRWHRNWYPGQKVVKNDDWIEGMKEVARGLLKQLS